MRSEPAMAGSWAEFDQRLAETARWCTARARPGEPRQGLWTLDLAPPPLETDRFRACRIVAERRQTAGKDDPGDDPAGTRGRLLAYFPDADLSDGAAEVESRGFFDGYNTPPWDTWVALAQDQRGDPSYGTYVVAWVPASLIASAEAGIEVNPEECIRWLEHTDTVLAARLRERGWFGARAIERSNPPAGGWKLPFFRADR